VILALRTNHLQFKFVFCVYIVNLLVLGQFCRSACLLWKVRYMWNSGFRRCKFIKGDSLMNLLFRRVYWLNESILIWIINNDTFCYSLIRSWYLITSASIGSLGSLWSNASRLVRVLPFVSTLFSRRCNWRFLFVSLGTESLLLLLMFIEKFGVKIVDVAEGINFGLLLGLDLIQVLLYVFTSGAHQISKWSSIWILVRHLYRCRLESSFAELVLLLWNSKSVSLLLILLLFELSKLIP